VEQVQPLDREFSWRGVALAFALVLVIALAVVGGIVLLGRLGGTRPVTGTGRVSKRQATTPLRPRSHVSVLVLNGNGMTGAAGTEATRLLARGYRAAHAADAGSPYATSLVLFRPGWQREARRLAHDARIGTIAPLDGSLPHADARYRLVLILGAA
jgi:LytR cell envelope-related transcriptional attenuator